jgi:hypothetical protein
MKRIIQPLAIAFLALLGVTESARGQKTYALGVGGGAAIPVGKLSDSQKTGANGMVVLALGASDLPIGVRFDGVYNSFSRNDKAPVSSYTFRAAGLLGNLIYAFPGTNAKTYLIAGAGLYNIKLDVAGSKSENHGGLNAGAGVTFGVGPIAAFIESRYHFISRAPDKGGVIHFVPITFGILF